MIKKPKEMEVLKRRGIRISGSKKDYIYLNEREIEGGSA